MFSDLNSYHIVRINFAKLPDTTNFQSESLE